MSVVLDNKYIIAPKIPKFLLTFGSFLLRILFAYGRTFTTATTTTITCK